ncbi:MAG: alpha/beta hydrolase-fold protein [Chloroflexi bacterium]|nr:alpha/beta hydrolase-fold protein [Chloroflexota bacterium]
MTANQATILASEVRMMKSKSSGREYRISIALPYAYFDSPNKSWPNDNPLEKWPVVYLTDANWYFGMVTDMVRQMAWCDSTTDAIIVGIGYPEEDKDAAEVMLDTAAWRQKDFLPVRDEKVEEKFSKFLERKVETGGAGNFLEFIKQELIPTIEAEFKADPKRRILAGHSFGGIFSAFALLKEPGLFESYVIASPSLGYGDQYVFKQEEEYARSHKKLPAKVYLCVGGLEESTDIFMVSNMVRFGAILEGRKYKGLSLVSKIFANENHCEVVPLCFQAGLKMALKK